MFLSGICVTAVLTVTHFEAWNSGSSRLWYVRVLKTRDYSWK